MNELALFAGAGGGILAGQMLGWRTVCAVERDAYAAAVLAQRQNDGCIAPFPIWSDVETFDGRPWRGRVDVISGGFPCQDISVAGKGAGIDGERSGMWREFARIIREVRPRFVFVENSPALTSRGLGVVLGDLAALGFDAEWGVLGASAVGAPHRRERIWIVGNAHRNGRKAIQGRRPVPVPQRDDTSSQQERNEQQSRTGYASHIPHADRLRQLQQEGSKRNERRWASNMGEDVANANCLHEQGQQRERINEKGWQKPGKRQAGSCGNGAGWWGTEPDVGRVANGVAHRVDRLKALGNGQVPQCAAEAFRKLYWRLND